MPPSIETADRQRRFACAPVALLAFIIDPSERFLLLSSPSRDGGWEVVNGALEAGETLIGGTLREAYEEAGPDLRLRPLGTLHASAFHYDDNVRHMLSISFLLAYEGGTVTPGDDMAGSDYGWFRLDELESGTVTVDVPPGQLWQFRRAVDLYRLWKDERVELQPALD